MKQEDIEKAWRVMSMHNSELLLENAELRKRLDDQSVRRILWNRIRNLFRRYT
jgi:hypothetical protein